MFEWSRNQIKDFCFMLETETGFYMFLSMPVSLGEIPAEFAMYRLQILMISGQ